MTTLYVPLHLPVDQARRFLDRELRYRKVTSFRREERILVITHEPEIPTGILL